MATGIDLTDPNVRKLLGDRDERIATPASGKKQIMQVAGDMDHGIASRIDLTNGKTEVMVFDPKGDVPLLTVDVYALPGEPLKVHLICPRCRNHLTIPGDRKAIEFAPNDRNPRSPSIIALGIPPHMQEMAKLGRLSVEPFECTWELDAGKKVGSSEFTGNNLCRWRAAIDNNTVKAA